MNIFTGYAILIPFQNNQLSFEECQVTTGLLSNTILILPYKPIFMFNYIQNK